MSSNLSDPLDDALDNLRVSGAVLLHEAYLTPWAIAVPGEARLRQLLGASPDVRILVFHFVRNGEFALKMGRHDAVPIRTAEVVICPSGAPHRMARGKGAPSVPFEAILRGDGPAPAAPGTPNATELVCGAFYLRAAPLNPLLAALPPILRVATDDASGSPMLAGIAAMLTSEVDRGAFRSFTVARLLEVFCAETIRAYQRTEGTHLPGWFKGLADPRISEAIRQIHAAPARDWTVPSVAAMVALSPSRFAARFREKTGHSVMHYVSGWRANVACRMLRDTDLALTQIAHRVGYQSLPAFSRAFKGRVGQAPGAWRAAHADSRKHPSLVT